MFIPTVELFLREAKSIDERAHDFLAERRSRFEAIPDGFLEDGDLSASWVGLTFEFESKSIVTRLQSLAPLIREAAERAGFDVVFFEFETGAKGALDVNAPMRETLQEAIAALSRVAEVDYYAPLTRVDGFEMTPIEVAFYNALKETKLLFTPQARLVYEGSIRYRVDFVVFYGGRAVAVELDGHEGHKSKAARNSDAARDRLLQSKGFVTMRFTGSQVFSDLKGCMFELVDVLTARRATEI